MTSQESTAASLLLREHELLAVVAPNNRPLISHTVPKKNRHEKVAKLHKIPGPVLFPLFPFCLSERLSRIRRQAVVGVARTVVRVVWSLVPAAVVHRTTLHLPAPVHSLLSKLLGRGEAGLHVLPGQEVALPCLVLLDVALEGTVCALHLVLLDALRKSCPNLVLVAWHHLVHDATAARTQNTRTEEHGVCKGANARPKWRAT
mmetsp:Transcript_48427/g.90754  ORF Transcript_48427/g.90754 Transcript_48427/m.90754 type:complete len:203 (-) Transcript_48427:12-620(-)